MNILCVGDIVGKPGRCALEGLLPTDVQRVGIILSGGNIDLETLGQLVG